MTPPESALIGIDAGTTAVKTTVLTGEGRELATARTSVEVGHPERGHAEQSMDEVWHAVVRTVTGALEQARQAGPLTVRAIGLTGQGDGAWLLDEDHRPVGPAVLWLDNRATERVRAWEADGRAADVRAVTGSSVFPGALPPLLEELAETRPELLERARHQANCKDWIRLRLTGVLETDATEASRTYLDIRTGRYADGLIDRLGHRRFARLLPPVVPADAHRPLTAEAAALLGLDAGIPVATGMMDTATAGAGTGAVSPGEAYAIIGTTAFLGVTRASAAELTTPVGITLATGFDGQVLECLAPMSGSPNLTWARDALLSGVPDEGGWDAVEAEARAVPAGSGGVLYLPYGAEAGERAPFSDVHASAAWLGLSNGTTRGQLLRAVYEGIALGLRECRDALRHTGPLRVCGGAAASDLLCQILADVTGGAVERPLAQEVGTRGAAALALAALAGSGDLPAASAALLGDADVFTPDPAATALHDAQYATFTAVRDALRPGWPALRELRRLA
ncbi:FGGY family carbohydrate kinase [Streptomyces sp. NPDC048172]|uniref:FGGY family carbohydrate kinase n=1 Tax=Streptomyces sp. NPDC048172 TaxID=3365505 RepID=UPI00371A11DB